MPRARRPAPLPALAALALAGGLGLAAAGGLVSAGEAGRRLPEAIVPARGEAGLRTAVLAGGCFWGVQGVFQHVRGVRQAVSGYAGGDRASADYRAVSSGRTAHAEAVRVTYDPAVIRYDELLRIFFSVALDPTQVDRQGPDAGPQYRSALFPLDDEQARVARAYIGQLDAAGTYARPIATRIEPAAAFYPAEDYHQDYMALHPTHPYIVANDAGKVRDLARLFPEYAAPAPVLVGRPPA
ncbi:Peptide methionine sulfoxide reductase MsrA [Methylobacterium crusticola]|uniref:Peptide methionine sulfoxide reductase MsrA n=1 Tax=Methylobacterium crusticola TaxID=1697972 RepID=A0ABQ4R366_9HYPH|nr:peptide-methionine (S)-S-oxide reductase MsrA [Methylobacterium crusticola]GJD52125.1 Peptide methionine sulfoxide reductase MsrA [Methylobacterium crusticola]